MRLLILFILTTLIMASCVSSKKFKALEANYNELSEKNRLANSDLASTKTALVYCNEEKDKLAKEIDYLKSVNSNLMNNITEMTMLSKKEAQNLSTSLEKIKEKDLQIKTLNEAINRKDSMTIALVSSLKRAVGTEDKDIEINVEKGVVMVSISDKFLFKTGSYEISSRAGEVLKKVALVLQDRPDFEVLIEGHTDNVPFKRGELLDNWDLSVKRATALARNLVTQYKVAPERLIPAGRGAYVPLQSNDTAEGRAANRRTRVIIMPKIDQFYGLIEEGMKGGKK
ncbi:MAG: OmpA family protein [Microscillaceae bacterium]|jgi:chemotaxis protein MotB|nr:OmpA family protein [Microscillaceae bacterium]